MWGLDGEEGQPTARTWLPLEGQWDCPLKQWPHEAKWAESGDNEKDTLWVEMSL